MRRVLRERRERGERRERRVDRQVLGNQRSFGVKLMAVIRYQS